MDGMITLTMPKHTLSNLQILSSPLCFGFRTRNQLQLESQTCLVLYPFHPFTSSLVCWLSLTFTYKYPLQQKCTTQQSPNNFPSPFLLSLQLTQLVYKTFLMPFSYYKKFQTILDITYQQVPTFSATPYFSPLPHPPLLPIYPTLNSHFLALVLPFSLQPHHSFHTLETL